MDDDAARLSAASGDDAFVDGDLKEEITSLRAKLAAAKAEIIPLAYSIHHYVSTAGAGEEEYEERASDYGEIAVES